VTRVLAAADANHVVRHIPKDVKDAMKRRGLIIAGGFIRSIVAGEPVQDIDLFGDKDALADAATEIAALRGVQPHRTKNAVTVVAAPRAPLQFITRWQYSTKAVRTCLDELDFTVCQAAIWWEPIDNTGCWRTMCSDAFYDDLAARRLVYTFPKREEEAGGSMLRVRKFLMRGYNIQAASLAGVMARVFSKVRDSALATEGEEGCAKALAGILYEVDPLLIVDRVDPVDEVEEMVL
jgi:hypothetical protein